MLQSMYITYLRGFEGKPMQGYIKKGTILYKMYFLGKNDRQNNLSNRYDTNSSDNF